jgi:hypothetical protein
VEAVVKEPEVNGRAEAVASAEILEEARARVEAYLRAWKLPDSVREEVAATAMARAETGLQEEAECEPLRLAIEEAERAARARMDDLAKALPPLVPQREPETHPMTMETSLTRLPSLRIIAGWFALIALIVLIFILTR